MKKVFFTVLLSILGANLSAQFGHIDAALTKLQERAGNKDLGHISLDNRKFVLVKDFNDHTERNFVIINGKMATYVEMFDDKQTGESTSNVFTGDIVRSQSNIISLRADKLENQKIGLPLVKNFLLTQHKKVLILIDVNTKDRWIEENALTKK